MTLRPRSCAVSRARLKPGDRYAPRTLEVPLYLSFAFWESVTCAIYPAYIATLAIAVVGAIVGQLVHQGRIAVVSEDYRLVGRE